jgi:hypothetical protein
MIKKGAPMKLKDEIKAFNEKAMPNIPPETIKIMAKAAEKLADSGIVNRALAKDDKMPPFSLANASGQIVSSEKMLDRGALVISFYRGSW